MDIGLYVEGFCEPDETWRKMKAVYDACQAAGVDVPIDVEEFFGGQPPDPSGVRVEIMGLLEPWKSNQESGFELTLSELPPKITKIRFY